MKRCIRIKYEKIEKEVINLRNNKINNRMDMEIFQILIDDFSSKLNYTNT